MTNNDIYQLVNFITRKDYRGTPNTIVNFTRLLQQANLDKFKDEYISYQKNQNVNDKLSPFEQIVLASGLTYSATYIVVPDDYAHFIGMHWTDEDGYNRIFDLVTDSEWDMRFNSTLLAPTDEHPICKIRESSLYIDPTIEEIGYLIYYGSGAQGLSVSDIQQLTSVSATKANMSFDFSPSNEVFYYAYPASFGDLVSILDNNGFETLSDWTKTVRSFVYNPPYYTSTTTDYNVYEFNNVTTQTDFTNTFKFIE